MKTLEEARKQKTKFHEQYLFAPIECPHRNLETISDNNGNYGKGCYSCGIGFYSEKFPLDY